MLSESESSIIYKMSASKKRESIASLHNFNHKTAQYLSVYESVCDDILYNLKKRLDFSKHRHYVTMNYFKEFKVSISLESGFIKKLKNLNELEKKSDCGEKKLEKDIDHGIELFAGEMKLLTESFKKIQKTNESLIVSKIFKESVKILEGKMKSMIEKIEALRSKLEKKGRDVAKKLASFTKAFEQSMKDNEEGNRSMTEVIPKLISYINKLKDLKEHLEQYGRSLVNARMTAVELNHKRNIAIKKGIKEFSDLFSDFAGTKETTRFRNTMAKFQAMDIDKGKNDYFELPLLVTKEDKVKLLINNDIITADAIIEAISQVRTDNLNEIFDLFTRKHYFFNTSFSKGFNSLISISHDFFLDVYKITSDGLYENVFFLPVEHVTFKDGPKGQYLLCEYISKGVLWDSKKKMKMYMVREFLDELMLTFEFATSVVKSNKLPPVIHQTNTDTEKSDEEVVKEPEDKSKEEKSIEEKVDVSDEDEFGNPVTEKDLIEEVEKKDDTINEDESVEETLKENKEAEKQEAEEINVKVEDKENEIKEAEKKEETIKEDVQENKATKVDTEEKVTEDKTDKKEEIEEESAIKDTADGQEENIKNKETT